MHPFVSYEIAKGIVEEMLTVSEQRNRWRRAQNEVVASPPSWDVGAIEMMVTETAGEQEKVGA